MRHLLLCVVFALPSATAAADPAPIIGGTATTVGQYPSVVALRIGGGICTGTLITPDWVLTAAHCITPSIVGLPSQQAVTSSIRVHFNTVNLGQAPGTVVMASMSIPKPGFANPGANDIGLIKLAQPMTSVTPTPVNLDAAAAPVGVKATMVGFGATAAGGGGSVGVQFALDNRTSTACAPYGVSDANLLCFAQTDQKGKCQGDSGGPTFATIDGQRVVVGVTSFGDQTCAQFGADTRTDAERAFLVMHVPELERCEGDGDCMTGQVCFDHKCIAQPFGPGGLGTSCATGAECQSGICATGADGMRCTQTCAVGEASCPDGFECVDAGGGAGACWPLPDEEHGGCCDAGERSGTLPTLGMLGIVVFACRRRRASTPVSKHLKARSRV